MSLSGNGSSCTDVGSEEQHDTRSSCPPVKGRLRVKRRGARGSARLTSADARLLVQVAQLQHHHVQLRQETLAAKAEQQELLVRLSQFRSAYTALTKHNQALTQKVEALQRSMAEDAKVQ